MSRRGPTTAERQRQRRALLLDVYLALGLLLGAAALFACCGPR